MHIIQTFLFLFYPISQVNFFLFNRFIPWHRLGVFITALQNYSVCIEYKCGYLVFGFWSLVMVEPWSSFSTVDFDLMVCFVHYVSTNEYWYYKKNSSNGQNSDQIWSSFRLRTLENSAVVDRVCERDRSKLSFRLDLPEGTTPETD